MKRVLRRLAAAVHYVDEELVEGAELKVEVDWPRRFDHMQQHSGRLNGGPWGRCDLVCRVLGQHLITAVMDREYGYKTLSWSVSGVL